MVASIRSESPIWQNQVDAARWTWVLPLLATSLSLLWILVQRYYRAGLSKFPGPALAAVSGFYKTYVEVFQQGCFVHKLEELHAKYGDVVRTGPNELHFRNPSAYADIYNMKNRWDKDPKLYEAFGESDSSFGRLSYRAAKERKNVLQSLFSKKAAVQTHELIEAKVVELCNAFEKSSGAPVDLLGAFRCLSIETIAYIFCGQSVGTLQSLDFDPPLLQAMDESVNYIMLMKHFPILQTLMQRCPPWLAKILSPKASGMVDFREFLDQQVSTLMADRKKLDNLPHSSTIYHLLLGPEVSAPPSHLSILEETQTQVFAGESSGLTLMHGSFHIVQTPRVYQKLKEELIATWPNLDQPPSLATLERLPYLNAVVKESLRMGGGATSPLLRVVPETGAIIDGVLIAPGTVVGSSSHFVHRNGDIFHDPDEYIPERWMDGRGDELEQHLVAFGRGPRRCIGENFAWVILLTCIAHFYRKFNVELDPSSPTKLDWKDRFVPVYSTPHLTVRVSKVIL
ncbi:uncharacterized protein N7473_009823 [Penicillium subrubescens]|uniref:uncharacterized protein n=1 Tax=Penicillium subrubescens TaxID=1316194 RepID=UPI002545068C|nr:uncharacterized protein N7473_009823 [Penicillium subrubescens]KAJ5882937.1 hypothetical protein N7473_009823 [Penicillium subrubescens]